MRLAPGRGLAPPPLVEVGSNGMADPLVSLAMADLRRAAGLAPTPKAREDGVTFKSNPLAAYLEAPPRSLAERAAGAALLRALDATGGGLAPPMESDARPPPWAKIFYKAVAEVDHGKRHVSVFDGVTEYAVGKTVFQPHGLNHAGGLYVYRTAEACLRADAETFPSDSACLAAPRALARVWAWNETREMEPARYGDKLAFAFLRVDAILPYPASWRTAEPPPKRPPPPRTPQPQVPSTTPLDLPAPAPPSSAQRAPPVIDEAENTERHERRRVDLRRAQAATIRLEEEVRVMEERLASFRNVAV